VNGISLENKPFDECLSVLKDNIKPGHSVKIGIADLSDDLAATPTGETASDGCINIPQKAVASSDDIDEDAKMESPPRLEFLKWC